MGLLIFTLFYYFISSSCELNYFCELQWTAEGFGNVPLYSVSPSPGEFVARVNLVASNEWKLGRLLPVEGTTQVAFTVTSGEHTVLESDTYEVLTNPNQCVLQWIPAFGGVVPKYGISNDDTLTEFVARGEVAGFIMSGNLMPTDSSLYIPYEGHVYTRRHYDVLTSTYPRLTMSISDFSYPGLDFRVLDNKSKDVLVGQMEILSDFDDNFSRISSSVSYPITHSKNVKEIFQFEEQYGWVGLANISIEMDLWVGSPTVDASFTTESDAHTTLDFRRIREIQIHRTITDQPILSGESSKPLQICSSVRILRDFGVRYQALGEARGTGMTGDQVKELLLRSGRNIVGVTRDTVKVRLRGTLRGSFVIGTMATHSSRDADGACSSLIADDWRQHHARWS